MAEGLIYAGTPPRLRIPAGLCPDFTSVVDWKVVTTPFKSLNGPTPLIHPHKTTILMRATPFDKQIAMPLKLLH